MMNYLQITLKYLRRDGYDIGNHKIPEVKKFSSVEFILQLPSALRNFLAMTNGVTNKTGIEIAINNV